MTRYFHKLFFLAVLVVLAIALLPLSVESACANLGSVYLSQIYQGDDDNLAAKDALHVCLGLLTQRDTPVGWQFGMIEYLNGDLERATENLLAVLTEQNEVEQRHLLDQLLTFAPIAWQDNPNRAELAVNLAHQYQHDSPIGYSKLVDFYLSQIRAGEMIESDKVKIVARLAGESDLVGFIPKTRRAKAWFELGNLSLNPSDQSEALAAYQAAIDADPQDESWGYAWMSAWKLAHIYIGQQDWQAARETLTYAASLPDRYRRYSNTRMRLAQLEYDLNRAEQAIAILEETISRDPDYVSTRLYLASLYETLNRLEEARTQYQAVLTLDANQKAARDALDRLNSP